MHLRLTHRTLARVGPCTARRHISRSAELAAQYYEILTRASEDPGLTVRKRAIRLLWECCVRCPDFVHRSDALLRIVSRATDSEVGARGDTAWKVRWDAFIRVW